MRIRSLSIALLLLLLTTLAAMPLLAGKQKESEPDRVSVQHCLIGYKRSVPGKNIQRSKKEAAALAAELLARLQNGEDFDAIVREYTDDSHPGILNITNTGVAFKTGETSRGNLVPGFGDAAFKLEVGEVVLVKYHGYKSPYGWHLIKRLN